MWGCQGVSWERRRPAGSMVGFRLGGLRLIHKYEVIIFWSEEDRVFIAEVPELPGCAIHGDSPENALASCDEAIELWLDAAKEFGRLIPEPKGRRPQLA
jgi:predicted RNase H-like HicB family nuclease